MERQLSVPALLAFSALTLVRAGNAQPGGTWQTVASMPAARQELATAVLDGKVYVIGGFDLRRFSTGTVFVYNPNTNTWSSAQPIPFAVNHGAAAVAAGKLYSFGAGGQASVYNSDADSWAPIAPMNFQHGQTAAVGVIDDKIYVAGGTHGTATIAQLEVYDPRANSWSVRAPMTVERNHTGGAVIGGKFYVVGGRGRQGSSTQLEVYDPPTNTWSTRAPMPTGRSGMGVATVSGELWVFGGEIPGIRGEVEAYNPVTNTWRSLPDMPNPRHGIWASVIGNRVYLPGGGAAEGFAATSGNQVFIVDRKATFANISTRLNVQTGDKVMIGGFIVTGSGSKRIIIRARGPSVGVPGPLADPVLELYNNDQKLVATNNNWQDSPHKQEIIDSALAPPDDKEPAILARVDPGNYTAIVRGGNNSTGVALVEVYDLESGSDSALANISTRGFVQTGDNVLIGGLILTGSERRRAIVRAIGPSLPVQGALANPKLELRDAHGALIASNDNWRSKQEPEIIGTKLAPRNDLEPAILRVLSPGNYTAIVSGVSGTTGIALVEAYALE